MVIENRQHEVACPGCGRRQRGALPAGLEAEREFGPRLEATVTYVQHQQHLSYARTRAALTDLFGVALSEGGQACIVERGDGAGAGGHRGVRLLETAAAAPGRPLPTLPGASNPHPARPDQPGATPDVGAGVAGALSRRDSFGQAAPSPRGASPVASPSSNAGWIGGWPGR